MRILLCCHDFQEKNIRWMPWLYFYMIAFHLQKRGFFVELLSIENPSNFTEKKVYGIAKHAVSTRGLFKNPSFFQNYDVIVWSASPLTSLYRKKLAKIKKPVVLLYTGPVYSLPQVLITWLRGMPFLQLATHIKNALMPRSLSKFLLRSDFVKSIVFLSKKTASDYGFEKSNNIKCCVLAPGHNRIEHFKAQDELNLVRQKLDISPGDRIILYLGSLHAVRGVRVLLRSFQLAIKKKQGLILLLLARTEKEAEIASCKELIRRYRIEQNTKILNGILSNDEVNDYLKSADIVVLPFILVPSDMPVAALEAMAFGKPVITTDIDGLPEMVGDRGIIVGPGDERALAEAILKITEDENYSKALSQKCLDYMKNYPTWEHVSDHFMKILENQT